MRLTVSEANGRVNSKGKEEALQDLRSLLTSVKLIFSPENMCSLAASTPLDLACKKKTLRPSPTRVRQQESKLPSLRPGAAPGGAGRWPKPGAPPTPNA